jgi:hypothetical protein
MESTKLQCSASWHIQNGLAFKIYERAYVLSKTSKKFFASAPSLAQYFRCSDASVYRAIHQLVDLGFFELIEAGAYDSNKYRVVLHTEWRKNHVGQCVVKLESTSGEGDPLGVELYALSGGTVRFKPQQIVVIRSLGFSEDETRTFFTSFFDDEQKGGRKRRFFPNRFIKHLRDEKDRVFLSSPVEATKALKGRAKALRENRLARLAALAA